MTPKQVRRIRRALEDRGYSLADIGRMHSVTRQAVSRVLRYPEQSAPIRATIAKLLGRDPFSRNTQTAA